MYTQTHARTVRLIAFFTVFYGLMAALFSGLITWNAVSLAGGHMRDSNSQAGCLCGRQCFPRLRVCGVSL